MCSSQCPHHVLFTPSLCPCSLFCPPCTVPFAVFRGSCCFRVPGITPRASFVCSLTLLFLAACWSTVSPPIKGCFHLIQADLRVCIWGLYSPSKVLRIFDNIMVLLLAHYSTNHFSGHHTITLNTFMLIHAIDKLSIKNPPNDIFM